MKKKILIFSFAYYPKHIGGAEVAIKEIVERLPADQFEFHLVCNRYDATLPKVEQIGKVLVHRIGLTTKEPTMADLRKLPLHLNKLIYQFAAYRKAKQLHKEYHYDGIWAMMAHSCGVLAGKFKKIFQEVRYFLTLQEGDPPSHIEKKMRMFGSQFTDAFLQADTIQVISNFLGSWARQKGFAGQLELIPNAVNTGHFSQTYSVEELAGAKKEIGKKEGDVFLVTTSRLVHKNGIDDVVRAIAKLPKNIHFVVYGTGPDEQMLQELIAGLEVADRIHMLGYIDHAVMPLYLKACDIFIRPSRSEGMGNSFVEAMAAGLPVIATQEGGIADFLFDRTRNPNTTATGWAVSADSPDDIVRAVQDVIAHPERTAATVTHAQEMVLARYDWDLIADDMQKKVFDPLFE